MIKSYVSIYNRGRDGVYLHANAFTNIGLLCAVPPFIHLTMNEIEDDEEILASNINDLLKKEQHTIPHVNPDRSNILEPLYTLAGCKTWGKFARECKLISIALNDESVDITMHHWDGKGFSASRSDRIEYPERTPQAVWQKKIVHLIKTMNDRNNIRV